MSNTNRTSLKKSIGMLLLVLASVALGFWASQQFLISSNDTKIPPGLDATVLPHARVLQPFALKDHDGNPFTPEQLKGHWSFMFFGFTNCPDVCPTTLKTMQDMWRQLPTKAGDAGHPKLYFVSVDPERDKLDTLKPYVTYFNKEFVGVAGPLNELDKLTNQIGVLYGYEDRDEETKDYVVNHSAQLILIDPQARMRAVISPPFDASILAQTYKTIRLFYGN